jgi:GNAT superfamily N-acetyltransferase
MIDGVALNLREPVADTDLNTLFAAAWLDRREARYGPVLQRSLTWVTARSDGQLVGFVNVATDGGIHAFLLDTTVHPDWQRQGIGRRLVTTAINETRRYGITWMHVDYEPHLDNFYRGCGFRSTVAGLLHLT